MKTRTNEPKKIDPLPVVRKLLRLQLHFSLDDPISNNDQLLHLALDLLGVPPEDDCRDWYVSFYGLMVLARNDIDGFVDIAAGKQVLVETNSVAELEEALDRIAEQRERRRALLKPRYLPSAAQQREQRRERDAKPTLKGNHL